jgi:organic radical activating enzyme
LYYFEELSAIIDKYLPEIVVWTGGEPLKQYKRIEDFLLTRADVFMVNHIETNGELIASGEITLRELGIFEYVCCSPKELEVAKEVFGVLSSVRDLRMVWDTKVVTDLATVGTDMLQYATMLMPYTSGYPGTDADIRKLVWNYCVEKRLRYSPRLHVEVFGTGKRGI